MFFGSIPALVTPFSRGSVAEDTFRELVEWQVAEGSNALVPCGTTGEVATLSRDEHRHVVATTVEAAAGRVPVIAGCGSYSTEASIEMIRAAADVGADAALVVVPYYNRPSQAGLAAHFNAVAEASPLPIIVYNVPSRTVADISVETLAEVARHPRIVGIKDATGNIGRGLELLKAVPQDFAVYSGDDATALALMLCGGAGNVSVTANVAPRAMHEMCVAAMNRDIGRAIEINNRLLGLNSKLFVEPNPVPVKWALAEMGMMPAGLRLPLAPLSAQFHETVRGAMREAGVSLKS